MSRQRETFPEKVKSFQPLLGVGVHNPLTAALAEAAQVDLLWLSSLELSTSRMLPDANVMGFNDLVPVLREIALATSLPIIADADNGYGSPEAVRLAARHFEQAGASAISIEDNCFPKRNSFLAGCDRSLEPVGEFCQRIEAARAGSDRLLIVARTEALVAGLGAREAVLRAQAYLAAGADILFVQTQRSTLLEYQRVLEQIKGSAPVLLTPTAVPERTPAQLHQMGIDIVIHSNVVIRTLVRSLRQVLGRIHDGACLADIDSHVEPMSDVLELTHGALLGRAKADPVPSSGTHRERP